MFSNGRDTDLSWRTLVKRLTRGLSGLVWPALFLGILPLAIISVINELRYYQSDEQHLASLDFYYYPATPGRWLSTLVCNKADFLVTDIGPDAYLQSVLLFAILNSFGWLLILLLLRLTFSGMKRPFQASGEASI